MNTALQNYQGQGITMWDLAKLTISPCGRWYGTNTCTAGFSPSSSELNDIWNQFKYFYLSEKQKIQADMADVLAKANTPLNCYNGGIPIEDRRFINLTDVNTASSMNEIENDTDYKAWLLTGQCPNAFDVQLLLNGLAGEDKLTTTPMQMLDVRAFTPSLYQVISELDPTASNYQEYTWSATNTNNLLTVNLNGSGALGSTVDACIQAGGNMLTLDLQSNTHFSVGSGTNDYNWGNYGPNWRIERFDQFTATGMNSFTVLAYVDFPVYGQNTLTEVIINGTTCIPLQGCENPILGNNGGGADANGTNGFNSACLSTDLVNSVTFLMNEAILSSAFNTTYSLPITTQNATELQPIVNQLTTTPTVLTWSAMGGNVYEINSEIQVVFTATPPTNMVGISSPNPLTNFIVETKVTRTPSGSMTPIPINPYYPPTIEDVVASFELFDIVPTTSEPIVVTNCCTDNVFIDNSNDVIIKTNRVSSTECEPYCIDPIEIIQNCNDVEIKISLTDQCGNVNYITDLGTNTYVIDYGDGTVITGTGMSLGAALHYTYVVGTTQTYTISVVITLDSPSSICFTNGDSIFCDNCDLNLGEVSVIIDPTCIKDSCVTVTEDISTGYDQVTSMNIAGGLDDDDWIITSDGDITRPVPRPAVVTIQQNSTTLPNASWISFVSQGTQTVSGVYTFERTFVLPNEYSSPILDFTILTQSLNTVETTYIYLNGNLIGYLPLNSSSPFIVVDPSFFNSGTNTIQVTTPFATNHDGIFSFILDGGISFCPPPSCIECLPDTTPPVACYTKYEDYRDYIVAKTPILLNDYNNGTPAVSGTPSTPDEVYFPYYYVSEEEFCTGSYKLSVDAYMEYMDDLISLGVTNPFLSDINSNKYFVSFNDFVLNDLGIFVPSYITYITAIGYNTVFGFLNLKEFAAAGYSAACVNQFIFSNPQSNPLSKVCEDFSPQLRSCIKFNIPQWPTPPELPDPCELYMQNLAVANGEAAYNTYITEVAEDFRERYIKFAIENAIETFTMTTPDQEYHYTLYNYDQGGNLISTVPPRGVNRFDFIANPVLSSIIKQIRATNVPDPMFLPTYSYKTTYKYNTLNQLIEQTTPDGGTSKFWYDALGRLVASQNAEQAILDQNSEQRFSYTKYDDLGRITEVGQLSSLVVPDHLYETPTPSVALNSTDYPYNNSWPAVSVITEVTRTYYDEVAGLVLPSTTFPNGQENLRNRVARTTYQNEVDLGFPGNLTNYDRATHYSYDIHGNVKLLVQENKSIFLGHSFKEIAYTYDLISGNVLQVDYQKGQEDAFHHKYEYDADNRITNAWTSENEIIWAQDAKYFYYDHGPLARTEIGHDKVQGTDYAYTIQGWLKANNGTVLNPVTEMGKDGATDINNLHANIGTDAYGFNLSYYTGDYFAREATANTFKNDLEASLPGTSINNLYNGNIAQMAVALADVNEAPIALMANNYTYDQLNRIKSLSSYENGLTTTYAGALNNNKYATTYKYDPNGNLLTLNRNDGAGTGMDDLKYYYLSTNGSAFDPEMTNQTNATNRLAYVTDNLGSTNGTDLGGQSVGNYSYDAIGNLKSDVAENISDIEWTVYGKIKKINRPNAVDEIEFEYDASGNRVTKIVKPSTDPNSWAYTYYVRDASGNVMATYRHTVELLPVFPPDPYPSPLLRLKEHHIYGSSRIGIVRKNEVLTPISYSNQTFDVNTSGWSGENGGAVAITGAKELEITTTAINQGARDVFGVTLNETYTISMDVDLNTATSVKIIATDILGNVYQNSITVNSSGNYSIVFTPTSINVAVIKVINLTSGSSIFKIDNVVTDKPLNLLTDRYSFSKGKRNYELTNHLGNVMAVVTDKKIPTKLENYYWNFNVNPYNEVNGTGINPMADATTTTIGPDGSNAIETNTSGRMVFSDDSRLDFGNSDFTISVWVKKISQLGWGNAVVSKWYTGASPGTNEWALSLNGSGDGSTGSSFIIESGTTKYSAEASTAVSENVWHFIVGKREGGYISLYVDGVLEATTSVGNVSINNIVGREMILGGLDNGLYSHLNIDELRIFKTALSDAEIFDLYNTSNYSDLEYTADVISYSDYYPFGSLMPGRYSGGSGYRYGYQGSEKDDEITGVEGSHMTTFFREIDTRLGRMWSVDPVFQPWQSPYNSMENSPIWLNDPRGDDPHEYEKVVNEDGSSTTTKVGPLGGDKVDFTHIKGGKYDGKTEVKDKTSGEIVHMNSSKNIKGFTLRENGVNWESIYDEFLTGEGPENSLITSEGMWGEIMKSPQFKTAINKYLDNHQPFVMGHKADFGISGVLKAGNNMTAQMIGKSVYSFYTVGDRLVITIMDSKSVSSYYPWAKLLPESWVNTDRPKNSVELIPESTTRQTYLKIFELAPIKK